MRTKSIILGAALLAAGVATSMAQVSNVFSVNVVGYVNVNVASNKFQLLNNPLDDGKGNIVTNIILLPDSFDSSIIYTYSGGALNPIETFFGGFGWFPGTNSLNPGQGYYLYTTTNGTVTFAGNVKTNTTVQMIPGFTLVGSAYPASLDVTALGIQGQDGDIIFRWDFPSQSLDDLSTFFGGYGWYETVNNNPVAGGTGGPTNGFTANVGEGYFYNNSHAGNNTWAQAFSIH